MDNGAGSYRRFLDGDKNALTEIIKDYKDGLIFYLAGFTGDIALAEDLTQDVFIKLYTRKPRYSGRTSFKTWLYIIGRNIAVDSFRKEKASEFVSLDEICSLSDEITSESDYFRKERTIQLHNAMSKLKNEYYQVLWLTYFEGFSNKETAKIMRKSLKSTEVLLSRARKALKTKLESEGYNHENI